MATKKLTVGVMNAIKVRQCPFLSRCPLCAIKVHKQYPSPAPLCLRNPPLLHAPSLRRERLPSSSTPLVLPPPPLPSPFIVDPSCPSPPSSRLMPPPPCQVLAKVDEANQIGRVLPPDALYNQLIR